MCKLENKFMTPGSVRNTKKSSRQKKNKLSASKDDNDT